MSELFEKKNWIGEFWWEDKYENRFSGEIDYSFGNIINLSYFINFNSRSKLPVESNTISGEIATEKGIKKCTLVGKLILPSQQYGSFRGEASFSFLIIGKHLKHDELFHNLSFKLTGMQEFFSTVFFYRFQRQCKNIFFQADIIIFLNPKGEVFL